MRMRVQADFGFDVVQLWTSSCALRVPEKRTTTIDSIAFLAVNFFPFLGRVGREAKERNNRKKHSFFSGGLPLRTGERGGLPGKEKKQSNDRDP